MDIAVATTERWIELDHPDQKPVFSRGPVPAYIRIDDSHELPIVLGDRDCKPIARFASLGDAALFVWTRIAAARTVYLPATVVGSARSPSPAGRE